MHQYGLGSVVQDHTGSSKSEILKLLCRTIVILNCVFLMY